MSNSQPLEEIFTAAEALERPLCVILGSSVKYLPYRKELMQALQACRRLGRRLILVGSNDQDAHAIAKQLQLFDDVIVTGKISDSTPLDLSQRLVGEFGEKGFDCVGDTSVDASVLAPACRGYLLMAPRRLVTAAKAMGHVTIVSRQSPLTTALIKQLRPHQWAKNALVFLPLLLAPVVPSPREIIQALVAVLAFSLCASAGYVFNDLLDIEADRMHSTKYLRPFASGALPTFVGAPLFIGLLAISFGLALGLLPGTFSLMLVLYFLGTLTYSLYLKRVSMLDVLVLAGLYTHRILAGGIATGVKVSTWLLGFSMFLFTSLAFAKRFVELRPLGSDAQVKNRGYSGVDVTMVSSMGTASGFISALVFTLYVDSAAVRVNYREPVLLWLVLPILLYWLGRIWLLTGRGQMRDDPVKFALTDKISILCAIIVAAIATAARHSPGWISSALH